MNKDKIAILVDSCTDVPKKYLDQFHIYVVPLFVIYKDREYYDGVDITASEVYERFEQEIPKTSLPSPEMTMKRLDQIKSDGYKKVIIITISSGLSGTYNMVKLVVDDVEDLECCVIDTKNIAVGSAFSAIYAGYLLGQGYSFEDTCEKIRTSTKNAKVFFCVATLEYLKKGGRIGLVSSMLGTALNLKPIISCNEEGIYYTVSKAKGRKRSLNKAMELAVAFAGDSQNYNIAIVHGNALEEANEIRKQLQILLPNSNIIIEGQISPALVVHTGPGTIGIGIQKLD